MFVEPWDIIDTYYKTNKLYLTRHHIDSYNDLISKRIPDLINTLNPIEIMNNKYNETRVLQVTFDTSSIKYVPPKGDSETDLLPNTARLQNLNYFSDITIDINIKYVKDEKVFHSSFFGGHTIGTIPIMLFSKLCTLNGLTTNQLNDAGECMYDQGGYFIVDGKEKVIISQERIATNKLFINQSTDPIYLLEGMIRSTSVDKALFPKTVRFWICKDIIDGKIRSECFKIRMNIMNINLKEIPVFIIFCALGIESDKEILNYISYEDTEMNNLMRLSVVDRREFFENQPRDIYSTKDALEYLSNT